MKWNLSVSVEGAPTLTSFEDTDTDAIDSVSVVVEKNASFAVEIQPGSLDEVKFLYIKLHESDLYKKITYKFSDENGDSSDVILDKDHFLASGELIKLYGKSPKTITFTNSDNDSGATIDVVVARKAGS